MEYKKQHWVPRSYLQEWCDPDVPENYNPFIWMFSKDGKESKRRDPKNIFYEPDMYTIFFGKGNRNLAIEKGLGGLEDEFSKVRMNVLNPRRRIKAREKLVICAFIAASRARTRSHRDHLKEQWGQVTDLIDHMKEAMEKATPEQRKNMAAIGSLSSGGPSFSEQEVRGIVENPLQQLLLPTIQAEANLLFKMNLKILYTENSPGFITSDSPCVWFDPEARTRPLMFRSPGLMYPKIEVTLPISPKQLALISRSPGNTYLKIPDAIVDELNRRTRFHCKEHFIVQKNITKPIWFL